MTSERIVLLGTHITAFCVLTKLHVPRCGLTHHEYNHAEDFAGGPPQLFHSTYLRPFFYLLV